MDFDYRKIKFKPIVVDGLIDQLMGFISNEIKVCISKDTRQFQSIINERITTVL